MAVLSASKSNIRSSFSYRSKNKEKRHAAYLKLKKAKKSLKRDQQFRRKREEDKNPRLRALRQARNVPTTIDRKRTWDENDPSVRDGIGLGVEFERFKKPKLDEARRNVEGLTESNLKHAEEEQAVGSHVKENDHRNPPNATSQDIEDDLQSLIDSSVQDSTSESECNDSRKEYEPASKPARGTSPPVSTGSTAQSLVPEALAAKFPSLFKIQEKPKTLITTGLGGTIHAVAETLTEFFPESCYVQRQRHRYKSHHFSLREIAKFASNRGFTALVVLNEDHKHPSGLTIIHLPAGPTFHFAMKNWAERRKVPGHGRSTDHQPELILNNFRTPLGLLTAHLFRTLFPPQPEFEGRQVITLHNQRDYIFVRRHRYVFRDKRLTEKSITSSDGKPMKGVEEIRTGLQELGPRFTLKLRRIDKGIQRASGQEWEWRVRMEQNRTKFQL